MKKASSAPQKQLSIFRSEVFFALLTFVTGGVAMPGAAHAESGLGEASSAGASARKSLTPEISDPSSQMKCMDPSKISAFKYAISDLESSKVYLDMIESREKSSKAVFDDHYKISDQPGRDLIKKLSKAAEDQNWGPVFFQFPALSAEKAQVLKEMGNALIQLSGAGALSRLAVVGSPELWKFMNRNQTPEHLVAEKTSFERIDHMVSDDSVRSRNLFPLDIPNQDSSWRDRLKTEIVRQLRAFEGVDPPEVAQAGRSFFLKTAEDVVSARLAEQKNKALSRQEAAMDRVRSLSVVLQAECISSKEVQAMLDQAQEQLKGRSTASEHLHQKPNSIQADEIQKIRIERKSSATHQ